MKFFLLLCGFQFIRIDTYAQSNQWVWMKGDSSIYNSQVGVYGTQGVVSSGNKPGSRHGGATWTDASGNFWLFGGTGYGENYSGGLLNDLWKFNPATNQWTWIKGSKLINQNGVYGTINVAASGNNPGGRTGACTWIDGSGNLWMFGGAGYDEVSTSSSLLNDLWKYIPATNQWVWMKGDKLVNKFGVYGTQGTAAAANTPGSRYRTMTWIDGTGNFWLLGGNGYGESGLSGRLNDMWRYNPVTNQWTWMKGDKLINTVGVYGTAGTAAAANKPGARYGAVTWKDAAGVLWMMGGFGLCETTSAGYQNDIWKYSTSTNNWTWVGGDKTINSTGIYGTQGIAAAGNKPGGRVYSGGWTDNSGNFWLFGGTGFSESGSFSARLNDLWKYNPATNQWAWMKGSKTQNPVTAYGQQGVEGSSSTPGARELMHTWKDAAGNFYLLGGFGTNSNFPETLNDLWKFNVATGNWVWLRDFSYFGYFGQYGTSGVGNPANKPGSRRSAATWTDPDGNLWLFGGFGNGSSNQNGLLNDLWKYSPGSNQWIWVKGDTVVNQTGVYGSRKISSLTNKPGSRDNALTWVDNNGNLWLFGGDGYGNSGPTGKLNDLWKFDRSSNAWTWINGDSIINISGIYGTAGVPDPANKPGGRSEATGWRDATGKFWLFGGNAISITVAGVMSDLWRYDPVSDQWTWVNGNYFPGNFGDYGTQGVSSSTNYPGDRFGATSFLDADGSLWMFGGYGLDEEFNNSYLNDLWKYDTVINQWIWMSGSRLVNARGVYGTRGVSAAANVPGARVHPKSWTDIDGNLWIFGGEGFSILDYTGYLNDLWKYDKVNHQWTWMKGENYTTISGYYGSLGNAAESNSPGGRMMASSWQGTDGKFWLFGGYGLGSSNNVYSELNDMWNYIPCTGTISLTPNTAILCQGVNSIHLVASGGNGFYQWYKNDQLIPSVVIDNYDATSAGVYFVTSAFGSCIVNSNSATINPGQITPALGGTGVYCLGDPVNVGIPITQIDQSYTWLRNNSAVYGPIGGNGGNQSLQFNMDPTRVGTYRVTSSKTGCANVLSNTVYVGFAQINHLTVSARCNNTVSFIWDEVVPSFIPQKYQYAVTNTSIPPASGIISTTNSGSVSSLSPSTTYYIHVRSACGFDLSSYGNWTTMSFTTEASPLPAGIAEWTGDVNSDFMFSGNWKCGFVPLSSTAVIIPGSRPNYPFVSFNYSVKSVDLKPGAILTVNDGVILTLTSQ